MSVENQIKQSNPVPSISGHMDLQLSGISKQTNLKRTPMDLQLSGQSQVDADHGMVVGLCSGRQL